MYQEIKNHASTAFNTSVGFGGSLAAMTISDWVGLAGGILTVIYMVLRIDAELKARKAKKNNEE